MAALQAGDARTARDEFVKELARAPDYHELHFWLAVAYLRLHDTAQARTHLIAARDNSSTRRDRDIYAAKLDVLNRVH